MLAHKNETSKDEVASTYISNITASVQSTLTQNQFWRDECSSAPFAIQSFHFGDDETLVNKDSPRNPTELQTDTSTTVLLAIANLSIRRQYAQRIRRAGLAVVEVEDGLTCLQQLRMNAYSLLIADLNLPWGNGDGIIEVMLNEDRIGIIPTILIEFVPPEESDGTTHGFTQRIAENEIQRLIEQHVNQVLPSRSRVDLSVDASCEVAVCHGNRESPDDEDTVVEEDFAAFLQPDPSGSSRQPNSCSLLIAIANDEERRRYANAFQEAGYRVSEATDGLSCLSALRDQTFAILVLDQHLLWGSGDGVVEVMQSDPTISSVPVVLLNFPKPNERDTEPIFTREFVCEEILQIVQKRLAGEI